MTFATTQSSVQSMGPAGIYKMPPFGIPAPLPNTAMYMMAKDLGQKLSVVGNPVVVMPGEIPMSMGDSAGAMGGVVSGKTMGAAKATKGSNKLFVGGKQVIRQSDMNTHNDMNIVGMTLGPAQTKLMVSS